MTHAHSDPGTSETDVERNDLSTAFGDSAADSLRGLLAPRRAPVRAVDDQDVEAEPESSSPAAPSGEAEVLDVAVDADPSDVALPAEPSEAVVPAEAAVPSATAAPPDAAEISATDSTAPADITEWSDDAEPAAPADITERRDAAEQPEPELSDAAEPLAGAGITEWSDVAEPAELSDAGELAEPAEPLSADIAVTPETPTPVPAGGSSGRATSSRAVPTSGTPRTAPSQRRPRPTRVKDRDDVDLLLLAVVGDGVSNGREIVDLVRDRSGGAVEMPERRVYEELHRLRHNRLIADTGRGERARFVLTESGERILRARARRWQAYTRAMGRVLGGEPLTTTR